MTNKAERYVFSCLTGKLDKEKMTKLTKDHLGPNLLGFANEEKVRQGTSIPEIIG